MTDTLTISGLTFNLSSSDSVKGSQRREVSRGVNLPEVLTIKHQPYVDSATKKAGVRSVIRLDRYVTGSDGYPIAPECHLVIGVPSDALITSADVLACIARLVNMFQIGNGGLDLGTEIAITRGQ